MSDNRKTNAPKHKSPLVPHEGSLPDVLVEDISDSDLEEIAGGGCGGWSCSATCDQTCSKTATKV